MLMKAYHSLNLIKFLFPKSRINFGTQFNKSKFLFLSPSHTHALRDFPSQCAKQWLKAVYISVNYGF